MKITLFYDNVTVLDYAYLDHHRGVVGDSLKVHVEFIGTTDEEGVVFDFGHAKKKVKEIIDETCDHRLVIPRNILQTNSEISKLSFSFGQKESRIDYQGPRQAFCEVDSDNVDQGSIKQYLEKIIMPQMPNTVQAVVLTFESEKLDKEAVFFHYTHGLKQHYGNCQRLLHGHRSTLEVYVNDQRDQELETHLAHSEFSSNTHFVLAENILNMDEVLKETNDKNYEGRLIETRTVEIGYKANQGSFKASLPGSEVYILQDESTVENLSMFFAKKVKEIVGPGERVTVKAFEGIAKGAKSSI